jgi:transposase
MARKTYTREFKLQALKMLTSQGLSVAEVARRLGVRDNLLRNWRKAAQVQGTDAFPGHGIPTPAEDELRALRAEVHRLRAERDLLKKAAAYFASHPT